MEPEQEPDVRKYFLKIINTASSLLLWLIFIIMTGLQFGLAFSGRYPAVVTWIYYAIIVIGSAFLIRYYIRLWRKP
ncbi:MAG: hypothetical protein ABS85_01920 [Sphingobacteriales bacterium SCN 48-20]|jgi:dolichyl-phosphate-mannose--protein O-mannosyl transferase|uniref:hypothetical protein n=1 Tax=Terrimonas ferruginea TaxID=249 RepID=UPI00086F11D2|nr:hypothetical protein [Terrimonas ferruginea]MBN8783450.1 hypothetical protein [Terrimonas ferruginea]ODT95009.1 MAG: hypothetical protein ABS85_01920 [Sphingobacteriales bacterium SCN 48-20]OJW40215.1 MAG: hypothetical protein BGO56_09125 [Sphingobacteriales bacterium 48-107]